jgi:hypothetical protein
MGRKKNVQGTAERKQAELTHAMKNAAEGGKAARKRAAAAGLEVCLRDRACPC